MLDGRKICDAEDFIWLVRNGRGGERVFRQETSFQCGGVNSPGCYVLYCLIVLFCFALHCTILFCIVFKVMIMVFYPSTQLFMR